MSVSIGGTITINIRDFTNLPNDDGDCRVFCTDILGEECWQQISAVRKLQAGGVQSSMRSMQSPEISQRDVSIGISISGTF